MIEVSAEGLLPYGPMPKEVCLRTDSQSIALVCCLTVHTRRLGKPLLAAPPLICYPNSYASMVNL